MANISDDFFEAWWSSANCANSHRAIEKERLRMTWIFIEGHFVADGGYGKPEIYSYDNTVKVGIFPDLSIDLGAVFHDLTEDMQP